MKIEFFIPMRVPTVTQQEHKVTVRNGKPHFYEPAELKAARAKLRDHLAQHRPDQPLRGPVYLLTEWLFPSEGRHDDGEWKISKPDTDNLVKMAKDEMTRLRFWSDDAQVCSEEIHKRWARIPGLYVYAAELESEDEPE